jgi:hypothetical protein
MIPAFERAKAVHALDRAATVIGQILLQSSLIVDHSEYCCAKIWEERGKSRLTFKSIKRLLIVVYAYYAS